MADKGRWEGWEPGDPLPGSRAAKEEAKKEPEPTKRLYPGYGGKYATPEEASRSIKERTTTGVVPGTEVEIAVKEPTPEEEIGLEPEPVIEPEPAVGPTDPILKEERGVRSIFDPKTGITYFEGSKGYRERIEEGPLRVEGERLYERVSEAREREVTVEEIITERAREEVIEAERVQPEPTVVPPSIIPPPKRIFRPGEIPPMGPTISPALIEKERKEMVERIKRERETAKAALEVGLTFGAGGALGIGLKGVSAIPRLAPLAKGLGIGLGIGFTALIGKEVKTLLEVGEREKAVQVIGLAGIAGFGAFKGYQKAEVFVGARERIRAGTKALLEVREPFGIKEVTVPEKIQLFLKKPETIPKTPTEAVALSEALKPRVVAEVPSIEPTGKFEPRAKRVLEVETERVEVFEETAPVEAELRRFEKGRLEEIRQMERGVLGREVTRIEPVKFEEIIKGIPMEQRGIIRTEVGIPERVTTGLLLEKPVRIKGIRGFAREERAEIGRVTEIRKVPREERFPEIEEVSRFRRGRIEIIEERVPKRKAIIIQFDVTKDVTIPRLEKVISPKAIEKIKLKAEVLPKRKVKKEKPQIPIKPPKTKIKPMKKIIMKEVTTRQIITPIKPIIRPPMGPPLRVPPTKIPFPKIALDGVSGVRGVGVTRRRRVRRAPIAEEITVDIGTLLKPRKKAKKKRKKKKKGKKR